ncbi:hypothetical protein HOY80DRAFT_1138622 [Tuber brumale]|nr:hypothetical protein HOY80DRAFT_1138622 [Tuber brumale]
MGDEVATDKAIEIPDVGENVVEPAVEKGEGVGVELVEQPATPEVDAKQEEPVEENLVEDAVEPAVVKDEQVGVESPEQLEDGKSATVEEKDSTTTETKEPFKLQKKKSENIKFDANLLPESDDPVEIRKQVEFYFSDSNLPFDKFLFGLVGKDNRSVPLKLIRSFKRMRRFTNPEAIVKALHESEALVIAGDVGEETIRRKTPLIINEVENKEDNVENKDSKDKSNHRGYQPIPRQAWDADITGGRKFTDLTIPRSIYAKGFDAETPTTQIDLENFFAPYGPIACVRLRRTRTGIFKGSIFVEFKDEDLMKGFMALEEKPKWNDTDLQWLTKKAYCDGKIQDIKDGKIQPTLQPPHKSLGNKNGHRGNNQRGSNQRGRGKSGRGGNGGKGSGRHQGSNSRRGNGGKGRNDRGGPPKIKTSPGGVDGIPLVKTNGSAAEAKEDNNNKRKAENSAEAQTEVKRIKQECDNTHIKQEYDNTHIKQEAA